MSLIVAGIICLLFGRASAQPAAVAPPLSGKNVLIVYLSRTNNTKAIADIIHQEVGGAIVALELERPYPADYRAIVQQVVRENETGYLPPLKTKIDRIDQYDVVFVGFPTWAMRLPPPVKSFLRQYSLRGKTVVPFNTNAGYGTYGRGHLGAKSGRSEMKSRFHVLAMVAAVGLMTQLSAPLPASGQTPRPGPAPTGAPGPGAAPGANPLLATGPALVSPEVAPDRRVTFRFAAPNATQVTVTGIAGPPITMQKDERGVWTGTSQPLAPEIYQYNFMVDGARVTDPSNPRFMTSYRRVDRSALLVPGDNAWTPVPGTPRGALAQHLYHSAVTNDEREFYVYTPPGYDPKRRQPYPVVFLQHGLSEDARSWIQQGANTTLDNLINRGKAVPMIMVASLGYGMPNGPAGIDHPEMQRNFMRILTEEVMPVVYKQYNASTNPADHAIAGLSMGGGQAILLGLNRLDKFAWFGSFSGALVNWAQTIPFADPPARPEVVAAATAAAAAEAARVAAAQEAARAAAPQAAANGAAPAGGAPGGGFAIRRDLGSGPVFAARLPLLLPNLDARANNRIKLLWIGIGGDDPSVEAHKQLNAYLDSRGVKYTYTVYPNERHWWPLWHRNFAEFAQLIFK